MRRLGGNAILWNHLLQRGLVGWWRFEHGGVDSGLFRNHGTLTNGPIMEAGRVRQALRFDGSNDYVNVGDVPPFDTTFAAFTVSAWINPNSGIANERFITGKMGAAGQRGWQLFLNGSYAVGVDYFDGPSGASSSIITTATIPNTQWTHIVFTFVASSTEKIYINGALSLSEATTLAQLNGSNTAKIEIGNRGDEIAGQFFPGQIDDVRIYNRALLAEEIRMLYLDGVAMFRRSGLRLNTVAVGATWPGWISAYGWT